MTPPGQSDIASAGLAAHVWLRVESARAYGLIEGGPKVNVEACEAAIARAAAEGFEFTDAQIESATRSLFGAGR